MCLSRFLTSVSLCLAVAMLTLVVVWTGSGGLSARADEVVGADMESYEHAEIWHGNRRVSGPEPRPARETAAADEAPAEAATRPTWIARPVVDSRDDSRKAVAQDMLCEARRRIGQGEFQRARQLIGWTRDLSVVWISSELSPEDVAEELQRREAEQKTDDDPSLSGPPRNPFRTPSSLNADTRPDTPTPSPNSYEQRLRKLEARSPAGFDSSAASSGSVPEGDVPGAASTVRFHRSGPAVAGAQTSNDSAVLPPLVGFLAGVVCVLLVVAVGLAVVLRRFKAGGGSVFRVEIMSPPAARHHAHDRPAGATTSGPREDQVASVIPFPMPTPTSTFADRRRQQQQQVEQQEQALLKHIFEANVELHGELSKVDRQTTLP